MKTLGLNHRLLRFLQVGVAVLTAVLLGTLTTTFGSPVQVSAATTPALCEPIVLRAGDTVPSGLYDSIAACERAKAGTNPIYSCTSTCPHLDGCSCPSTCVNKVVADYNQTCGGNATTPTCARQDVFNQNPGANARACVDASGATKFECLSGYSFLPGNGRCVSDATPSCTSSQQCANTASGAIGGQGCVDPEQGYAAMKYCCASGQFLVNGRCQGTPEVPCYNRTTCAREMLPAGSTCSGNYSTTVPTTCECLDGARQECYPRPTALTSCTASCPAGARCTCPTGCARSGSISAVDTVRTCSSNPLLESCRTTVSIANAVANSTPCIRSNGTISRECLSGYRYSNGQCVIDSPYPPCPTYTNNDLANADHAYRCSTSAGGVTWACEAGYNAQRPLIGSMYCASNGANNTSPQFPQPITNCSASCPAGTYCACDSTCQNRTLITPESTNRACGGSALNNCRGFTDAGLSGDANAERCNNNGTAAWQCRSGYNAQRPIIGSIYCAANGANNTSPQFPQPLTNCTATCPAGNYCSCAANCQNQSLITPESTNRSCGGSTLADCRGYSDSGLSGDTNAERCNNGGVSTWQCRTGYNAQRPLIGGIYCAANNTSTLPACTRSELFPQNLGGNSRQCRDGQGNTRYECNAGYSLLPGTGTCVANSTPSCMSNACATTQSGAVGGSACIYNYSDMRYCCPSGQRLVNGRCTGEANVMCYNVSTCAIESRPPGTVCSGNYSATVPDSCECLDSANQQCYRRPIELASCTANCPTDRVCTCPANCARSGSISTTDTNRNCSTNSILPVCRTSATLPSTANGSIPCSRSNGTIGRECSGTLTYNGSQCVTAPATPTPTPTPTPPPACGSGLECQRSPIAGRPACSTPSGVVGYCCPSGQHLVNGTCVLPTPGSACNNADSRWVTNSVDAGGQCCGGGTLECKSQRCNASDGQLGTCLPSLPVITPTPTPSTTPTPTPTATPGTGGPGQPETPRPTPTPRPTCQYTYSAWSSCEAGLQNRQILSVTPANCTGTPETLVRVCGDEFYCESDSNCPTFAFCYQPPMPVCPPGMACPQVMPRKECHLKKSVADINKDNSVNIIDLSVLLRNLLTADTASDFNKDGLVDIVDYSWLIRRLSEKPGIDLINN